jgi:hypothetical protein
MHLAHSTVGGSKLLLVAYLFSLLCGVAEHHGVVKGGDQPVDGGCHYVLRFVVFERVHAYYSQSAIVKQNTGK